MSLSWENPNDATIANYDYRIDPDPSDGSSGWTGWQRFTTTTNSHTVTGLTNGTTYSFQVRANNNQGDGPDSDTVTATPSGPPAAPDLRADPGDGEVRLYWANPDDSSITKYQKHEKKGDEAYGLWEDISFPDTVDISSDDPIQYTVTGLDNDGTAYTFQVRAFNNGGIGAVGTATATPTASETAPAQMSGLIAAVSGVTGGSGGQVRFTWDNPDDASIDKYQYRYSTTSSSDGFFNWADVSGSSATTTSYPTGTETVPIPGSSATLFYEFRAVNDDADIDSTAEVNEGGGPATAVRVDRSNTAGTSPSPPDAPANVSISTTSTTVTVGWDKPSVTTNIIWQRQQSHNGGPFGDWEAVTTTEASDRLSFVVSSATGTYAFKIRAVDNKGNDDDSDDVNGAVATTESASAGAPNAPTLNSATPTDDTTTAGVNEKESQIVLSWTAGADITDVEVDDHEYRTLVSGAVSWTAWNSISGEGTKTTYTVIELLPSTTYSFQVRAVAGSLESDPSNAASGTTDDPPSGETIDLPAAPTGLRASAGDEQVTLNWSHRSPGEVKWYRYRFAEGNDASSGEWQQVPGTGATMTHTVIGLENGTTYSFQVQAVGAGDNNLSDPSNTATATPRVPRPPSGGGGTSRDSVTANNSDETIGVTIQKPASVTLDVAVVDQACAAAAPGGTVHLCVQASASGSGVVQRLLASPAFMTIVISPERWTQVEGAYNADPRRFFLSKRSSSAEAWANIVWCIDDPGQECYLLQETEQGGATVFVYNIVSFSQYAIRTVGTDGAGGGGGGSCSGINCRAVIIGGGGGTGRGPQHRLPATTRTPAPTARPTVASTVRPTVVPPTVTPTAVPPTAVPPTRVPPTALPPTPTEAPTPPVQVEAPTPPPPTPVDAPTPEPTEVTAALPPTAVAPAPTPIPPLVGEPEGNLPPWLLIVIIAAVLAVGGMGFLEPVYDL